MKALSPRTSSKARTVVSITCFAVLLARTTLAITEEQPLLGSTIIEIGDVDGDEVPDFAISAPGFDQWRGEVFVVSGRTLDTLIVLQGKKQKDLFGWTLASTHSCDTSPRPILLIGNWPFEETKRSSSVSAYDALNGAPLFEIEGRGTRERFPRLLRSMPDLDGDGLDDFIVNYERRVFDNPYADVVVSVSGIRAHSARTQAVLWEHEADGCELVTSLLNIGDFDHDGITDVAFGAAPGGIDKEGSVTVVSGRDGHGLAKCEAHDLRLTNASDFGVTIDDAGDWDHDGFPDLLSASLNVPRVMGAVHVISLKSDATIKTFHCETPWSLLGLRMPEHVVYPPSTVKRLPDLNGDTIPEFLIGVADVFRGVVTVGSGKDGAKLYELAGEEDGSQFGQSVCVSSPGHYLPECMSADWPANAKEVLLLIGSVPEEDDVKSSVRVFLAKNGKELQRLYPCP